ncbi:MAG: hypothetical protein AAF628_11635 [Planctomycetota bacterium]
MPHVIEPAASGRAKCRGCARPIAKGELRFGERLPNPFSDSTEMTLWFHLQCAAYKRPEPLLEALQEGREVPDRTAFEAEARRGVEHRRLPRLDGAERAPSGRAKCRACHETIAKAAWRVRLVFFEDGMFSPSGFIHPGCIDGYVGVGDVIARVAHFSKGLEADDRAELATAFTAPPGDARD